MTQDSTTDGRDRRTVVLHAALVAIVVLSVGSALVAAQTSFSDDFADGNADGWSNPQSGADAVVSQSSVEGDWSLYANSTMFDDAPDRPGWYWTGGPQLAMSEGFDVTGVMRYNYDTMEGANTVRIGLTGDDQATEGENAYILFNYDTNQTYIGTYFNEGPTGQTLDNGFDNEWVHFRLQSDEGDGTLRGRVWEYGTSEPDQWQMERGGFNGTAGQFGINPGNYVNPNRRIYLDSIQLEGETINGSEDLRMDVPALLQHNQTGYYTVEANQSGTWTDVTAESSVTPENPDALTFYDNGSVVATGNTSVNEIVNVSATYQGLYTNGTVVVAEPTVDNLDILPGAWWKVNATLSDWTIIWLLGATLAGVTASRFATSWAGIGGFVMFCIAGWLMGDVPTGLTIVAVVTGLFVGINLALNVRMDPRM